MAGIGFLALAKAKNLLRGYSSPRPFQIADIERCISYDIKVVEEWLTQLASYRAGTSLNGKSILELGPGEDMGVGVYLLAKGAAMYNACDVHNLTGRAPPNFYTALLDRIEAVHPAVERRVLQSQVDDARQGKPSKLRVVVRSDFNLVSSFAAGSIDLVFSQAAFEHFEDMDRTARELAVVCKPGAVMVAEIDLKTHSRWIRDQDPNNIYRYSDSLYRAFGFRGMPNRVRPYQYRQIFERNGWGDVSITPIEFTRAPPQAGAMARQFRDPRNQLDFLSIVLCATRR